MKQIDFIKETGINQMYAYMLTKRFGTNDYLKILHLIRKQHEDLSYCQDIMIDKKPKDVAFLFDTKNKSIIAHQFLNNLYKVRDEFEVLQVRYYEKILKLIEKYGAEYENNIK